MKLVALCRVSGVKVLGRGPKRNTVKPGRSETKNTAFAGDIYEGPESHIQKRLAQAYEAPATLDDSDDNGGGAPEPTLKDLKKQAADLGATEEQLKPIKSKKAALELIDSLNDPEGSKDDLGL